MHEKGQAAMMETTFLKVGKRCINVSNIGWTEAGGDPDKRWIDLIFSNHQKLRLTVRLFWKFISKNWKFIFEEQRTSNAVSISLWTTAHLTDKRPEKTIRKTGK